MNNLYFKPYMVLVTIMMLNTSCKNEPLETRENEIMSEAITIGSNYNLLNYSPNVYHDYFKQTDNVLGFSSLKPNSLKQHSIVKHSRFSVSQKHIELAINNEMTSMKNESEIITAQEANNVYGKTVSFKINSSNGLSASGDAGTEIEMYVPELVEITNPSVTNLNERSPLCDYRDFVLEWNADANNEEGLVVIAEYFGGNAIPDHTEEKHILNTDYIELDNGRTVLDEALFDGMPNLAFVDIILLRGNVTIEEIQGELYKFFAETHVRLPILLVRDDSTIVKQE